MNENKLLSILIVTFKQMEYLYFTIDSALSQNYPYIEMIISDDNTPYFPTNEVEQYIENNKKSNLVRYCVIHNMVNSGTVKNINIGLKRCRGECIKIIAGDDLFFDQTVCSKQMSFLASSDCLIVTGKSQECDAEMTPIYKAQTDNTNKVLSTIFQLPPKEYFKKCERSHLFPIATQALCFKREFFDKYGLYDERYRLVEDPPMEIKIITNGVEVGVVEDYVVKHRGTVGVSANDELFSRRRSQYYFDIANYMKNELLTRPELFPPFRTKQRYKAEMFRYRNSLCETKSDRIKVLLKNTDTVVWFALLRPRRAIEKLRILLRSKRKVSQ